MEPFIAEIKLFAGNYAPRGWALCDGQLLPISQNQALFALLGTTYGGDGKTTFALPDLRGRFPLHAGAGPGLTPHQLGDHGGSEHGTFVKSEDQAFGSGGGSLDILPPFLALNFIIALQGVWPSRD